MAPRPPATAFTVRNQAGGLLREIKTHAQVRLSTIIPAKSHSPLNTTALWDTGATNTAISRVVAEKLKLPPIGKVIVRGAHGSKEVNRYVVDILLPNNVELLQWQVAEVELEDPVGLLIGMDVITKGDFAITNVAQNTVVSFRMPSLGPVIDYVRGIKMEKAIKGKRKHKPSRGKKKQ